VTPDDVQVWVGERSAGPRPLSALREDFEALDAILKGQGVPEMRPDFAASRGLGLFVIGGSASFRRVVIEPL
jgi:hypothetical protein